MALTNLSLNLDNAEVSFSKWKRKETLMSAGNVICLLSVYFFFFYITRIVSCKKRLNIVCSSCNVDSCAQHL